MMPLRKKGKHKRWADQKLIAEGANRKNASLKKLYNL